MNSNSYGVTRRRCGRRGLVCALGEQRDEHHQVGQREQPLVGLFPRGFRCAGNEACLSMLDIFSTGHIV